MDRTDGTNKNLPQQITNVIRTQTKYFPVIKQIIHESFPGGLKTFDIATLTDDCENGFDCLFTTVNSPTTKFTMAVRLRDYQYKPYNEVTIRYRTQLGNESEWQKIKSGKGILYFYGYLSEDKTYIDSYVMVNLKKFHNSDFFNNLNLKTNKDKSVFATYNISFIEQEGFLFRKFNL